MKPLGTLLLLGLGGAAVYLYSKKQAEESVGQSLAREPSPDACVSSYPSSAPATERYGWLAQNPNCIENLPIEALQELAEDLYGEGAGELGALVEEWIIQLSEALTTRETYD